MFCLTYTWLIIMPLFYQAICQSSSLICSTQYKSLQYYGCSVCYDLCNSAVQTSNVAQVASEIFTFKSCEQQYCAQYKTIVQKGYTTTTTQCARYQKKYINEGQCLKTCCKAPNDNLVFTFQNLNQCVSLNHQLANSGKKMGIIIGITIGGLIGLIIVSYAVYFLIKRYSLCNPYEMNVKKTSQKQNNINDKFKIQVKPKKKALITHFANQDQKNNSFTGINNSKNHHDEKNIKWCQLNSTDSNVEIETVQKICSICLDQNTNCQTHCSHFFHLRCLIQWTKKNESCPLCIRQNVSPLKIWCQICKQKYYLKNIDILAQKTTKSSKIHKNSVNFSTVCDCCKMSQIQVKF